MSQQVQRPDTYASIRAILHAVGLREVASRDWWAKGTGQIGVHKWTWLANKEIISLKTRKLWEKPLPNEATLRRRINYLADERWVDDGILRPLEEPPLWKHLSLQIKDVNPWKGLDVVESMSGYRLA